MEFGSLLPFLSQLLGGGTTNYGGFGGLPKTPPMTTPPFNPDAQGGGFGGWNPITGMGIKNNPALGVLGGANPLSGIAQIGGPLSGIGMLSNLLGGGQQQQTPAPAAPPPVAEGEDLEVVGDGWKPRKPTLLGALADAYLTYSGKAPAFSVNRNARSMREAMDGFTNDPMKAIKRLSQIPGMEGKVWDLYNQVQDNARADGTLARQNRNLDMQNDKYIYSMTASMMGAAEPETWGQMRDIAIKRAQARGVDVSHLIPEEYDPTTVEYMRYGEVKTKDQMTMENTERWRERRGNQLDRSLDIRQEGVDNLEEYRDERTDQIDRAEAGRNARASRPRGGANGGGDVNVDTPLGPGLMSPDGKRLRVMVNGIPRSYKISPDGKQYIRDTE